MTTTCAGCLSPIDPRTAWVVVSGEGDPTEFVCTPHCLFDFARAKMIALTKAAPDLLEAVAIDLCQALDGLGPDSDAARWEYMGDCWERLGIVLGALAPSPVEYLRRSNEA